jgi:hypothetical protein
MRLSAPHTASTRAGRLAAALTLLAAAASALAQCQPPDASLSWRMVGEIVQNTRTMRLTTTSTSGWSTVDSVANLGTVDRRETLSGTFSENRVVSYAILRWGLGSNSTSSRTHQVTVTVPAGHRVRLLRQRREEIRDLRWDVVCAWQHTVTGAKALTPYGFGYTGTMWRLYDAFEVKAERL